MKTYRILAATVAAGLTLGLSACGDSKNPVGSEADDKLTSESLTEDDGSGAPSLDREGGGADGDLTTPGGGLPVTDQPVATAEILTVADLIEQLEATGTTAEETGDVVDQPFFTPVGQVLKVAGQDVQVFVYETVEALKEEARQVGPDGYSIGTTKVTWVAPPRFYAIDRFIVLYVGQDKEVAGALDRVLGRPFAGDGADVVVIDPLPLPPIDGDDLIDPLPPIDQVDGASGGGVVVSDGVPIDPEDDSSGGGVVIDDGVTSGSDGALP
ncbi:MAG: hypothetical protein IH849_07665 [Acidobacteria bacterium]|nr:hypothetical protein [Acidobacteriota bacterium]